MRREPARDVGEPEAALDPNSLTISETVGAFGAPAAESARQIGKKVFQIVSPGTHAPAETPQPERDYRFSSRRNC